MIALEILLIMEGLWLDRIYHFFLRACLSKISVQIVENVSSPFDLETFLVHYVDVLMSLRKFRYEIPYISNN